MQQINNKKIMNLSTSFNEPTSEKVTEKVLSKDSGSGFLEKMSLYVILATIFLAPLVFIPSPYAPFDVVKTVLLSIGIFVSCILYSISAIKHRTISLPRGMLAYSAYGLLISLFISTLLSSSISKSFIGQGYEIGTASFMFLMFVASFLIARLIKNKAERAFSIYTAIFTAFIVLALFQIVRMLGGANFMTFGILSSVASSLIGKWNDFGIFSALIGLLSFFALKFLTLRKGL